MVAVSGGPDSVTLLHALHTASSKLGITLAVAHFNHCIRGEQSDMDEVFVKDLAREFGIDFYTGRGDVPAYSKETGMGVEEAARELRYRFLYETAASIGANKIALGHNADDRAESVLINIIRGTGIDGLGSIRPIRDNLVRPLIDTFRYEIEAYIKETALPYRVDESNLDTVYTRNRVRYELLPLLEHNYNPNIKSALIRLAEIASAQSDLVSGLASQVITDIRYRDSIDVNLLLVHPEAIQYQIIRGEIERVKGDLKDITFEQADRIIKALNEEQSFTITLPPGNIYARKEGNSFCIYRQQEIEQVAPFEHKIHYPGVTDIPEADIVIHADIVESPKPCKAPLNEALIDMEAVKGELKARNILPGDRIMPFGMQASKKLQDVFVDKKIPREVRAKSIAITDDEKILWVPGIILSESARVTSDTKLALHLATKPQSNKTGPDI